MYVQKSNRHYQLLDVIGFADIIPDSGLVSKVISALADELEMKTIGRVRISEDKNGSYYMQLIRESHMFVYVSNNGLIIFSILFGPISTPTQPSGILPSTVFSLVTIAKVVSTNLVTPPKNAYVTSQNNAPGPPAIIAIDGPTILPIPKDVPIAVNIA